jgi:uncharacterized membrane protein
MSFPESDAERYWTAGVVVLLVAVVGGSVLFRDAVYGGFVWHYFWGPVYADAHNAACAAWDGGAQTLLYSSSECANAVEPVAYPGYTAVSEVGYALTLVFALAGVVFMLRRLDVANDPSFVVTLLPYMFFGGALRVLEDASNAFAREGLGSIVAYPLNAFIISPIIYFTVFAITVVALFGSVHAEREGVVEDYRRPLAAVGWLVLALTLLWLVVLELGVSDTVMAFHPVFTVLTLVLATIITAAVWWATRRWLPAVSSGTERVGAVVLWGHTVDGVSNVLGIDWGAELGLRGDLVPKHPANQFIIGLAEDVLPQSVQQTIGSGWPFLLVKVVAALFVLSLFDREVVEDSPRYATLMLVAILAVGLGPGTRDMLRATFGV